MYAIIKASGKQYRVEPGTEFETDRLQGEPGQSLNLDNSVLLLRTDDGVKIGTPVVPGAKVELQIVEHLRGDKIVVFKMKRRKRYRRTQGHRQELTKVLVKDIREE
ncbi:MAG: 50S ribosomal protein L21 [Lentisphaerae bacterium RIFOXYB12_FULL_65_16]|nr:MAG: 50S ribosomal protein L21 [Lentisphaerae bacterium RIFOXYA12_64_32]OGV89774.1 MAG: 50S ribosomal protein L21 [Lentisphaerae bacterium RIFOXYB12_FULL_65_16]